jgi:succinate-acetate transporter protein
MQGETSETTTKVKDTTANPAPLGLLGFGMTTVLLNIHNAGYYGIGSMILAMGIFYGGMAQIFAGIMEWKKGNTFGTVAFTSYGLFWLTLVGLLTIPYIFPGPTGPASSAFATDNTAFGWYLVMWGVFTFVMFLGTLKLNRALQFVFITLAILFWLLAAGKFTGNADITKVAGFEGIVCGFSAIYTGLAQVLNDVYGRTVAPIFPMKPKQAPQPVATPPSYTPPQQQYPPPPGMPPRS